jgi:hypothetical protein
MQVKALITAEVVDHTSPVFVDFDLKSQSVAMIQFRKLKQQITVGDVTVTYEDIIIPGLCPYEYEVSVQSLQQILVAIPLVGSN